MTASFRLNELAGSLSLATDLAAGIANEGALRTCVAATLIAQAMGASVAAQSDVYYVALFRYLGCSGYAHEEAYVGAGDDHGMLAALETVDASRPASLISSAFTRLARDAGFIDRARAIARLLSDPQGFMRFASAHCDQAMAFATTLGLRPAVVAALGDTYERWDGGGAPAKKAGEVITLAARITSVAFVVEVFLRIGGPAAVLRELRARSGGQLDPDIVDGCLAHIAELLSCLAAPSVWDTFLMLEPDPAVTLAPTQLADVALAFGRYADIKSPFSIGHSPAVADLASQVARRARLPNEAIEQLRLAALLHDVGSVSVPNGILDKRGPLHVLERERIRQHAHHSERILARSAALSPLAELVGAHHERTDGGGYPRARHASALSLPCRILAACDVAAALLAERAYRPAFAPEAAAELLSSAAESGGLDREVVGWLRELLGLAAERPRGGGPDGLSEREVEVLCHLARGRSNKEIGQRLFISPRTVQQHVRHIYEKARVSTRAAAALYATQHDLIGRFADATPPTARAE